MISRKTAAALIVLVWVGVASAVHAARPAADAQGDATPPTVASLIGKWTLTVETPVGARPFWLEVKADPADPNKFTGTLTTMVSKDAVVGDVAAGKVTFWFSSVGPGGSTVRVTFAGTAQLDGSLAGTLNPGQGTLMPWKAVRDRKQGECL